MLRSENPKTSERRLLRAAREYLGTKRGRPLRAVYEHGQWWITALDTGAQWAVCDATGGVDGFGFEQVTRGESE